MRMRIAILSAMTVLSAASMAQVAYTVQPGTGQLYTVDLSTNTFNAVGALGVSYDFGDLAYDSAHGVMYMVNGWGDGFGAVNNLYSVNLNTGAASLIGSTGASSLFGLGYDVATDTLYASSSTLSSGFYKIDRSTGAASAVGDPGHSLDGLTFVGSTKQMVGFEAGPGTIYSVSTTDGSVTPIGGSGFINNGGIAWDAGSNMAYTIDWSGQILRFDVANGWAMTNWGTAPGSFDGLAFKTVPEPVSMIALGVGLVALARRRRK